MRNFPPLGSTRDPIVPMMGGMKRLPILLTSIVVLLAACGEREPRIDPRDAVIEAMTAVYEAGTVHEEFEMSVSADEQSFTFTGEGDVDNEHQRASLTMDLGMLGGSMDMVVDGGVVYVRAPMFQDVATEWISMDPSKMDPEAAAQFGGLGSGTTDPAAYVGLFAGAVDVEAHGEEQVGGVTTTRYAGAIDLGKVLENFTDVAGDDIPPASRKQLEMALDQLGALGMEKDLPFEIWIDGDGFPRRQRIEMDFGAIVPGDGEASMEMTVEFSAFGEPVDIDVPKPSEVTDMTKMLGAGGAGAVSEASGVAEASAVAEATGTSDAYG